MPAEPDIDTESWSFDGEVIAFVDMAKAQIAIALREAEPAVAELGAMVSDVGSVARRLEALATSVRAQDAALAESIASETHALTERARAAAVSLQFHDRLVQRMTHAHDALDVLAGAIADRRRHHRPADWDRLRQQIRARYSMEQERVIFDLLVGGASTEHVVETLRELRESGTPGHVDFF